MDWLRWLARAEFLGSIPPCSASLCSGEMNGLRLLADAKTKALVGTYFNMTLLGRADLHRGDLFSLDSVFTLNLLYVQ